ncbi:hypothetical protein BDW66DRAFT_8854 [Aspergillus desertorum]
MVVGWWSKGWLRPSLAGLRAGRTCRPTAGLRSPSCFLDMVISQKILSLAGKYKGDICQHYEVLFQRSQHIQSQSRECDVMLWEHYVSVTKHRATCTANDCGSVMLYSALNRELIMEVCYVYTMFYCQIIRCQGSESFCIVYINYRRSPRWLRQFSTSDSSSELFSRQRDYQA